MQAINKIIGATDGPVQPTQPPNMKPSSKSSTITTEFLPQCRLCQDTGITGWKSPAAGYSIAETDFCNCARGEKAVEYWKRKISERQQLTLAKAFSSAGIPEHFRDFTLESLKARCANEPGKLELVAKLEQFVRDGYLECPLSRRYKASLILTGDYGRGKTGAMTPVLRAMMGKGKSGIWIEGYDFLSEVQAGYADGSSLARLDAARQAQIMLIDDLGDRSRSGEETEDRRKLIYQLINYRHNNSLPMLITTNLNPGQMAMQFGARTVERINESCVWLTMPGANLRGAM